MTPDPLSTPALDVGALRGLVEKAHSPNDADWMFPLKVVPSAGKPIIVGNRAGNLFNGYIATWAIADLIVAAVNVLPTLLATLSERTRERDEARAALKFRDEVFATYVLDPESGKSSHLHDHYRRGTKIMMCPPTNHTHAYSAWLAGKFHALRTAARSGGGS